MYRTDNGVGPRKTPATGCPRTDRCRILPCMSGSSTTASSTPTAAAPSSTTSPPGGWPSGWPPGPRNGTSPAAWSASSRPGRSARTSRRAAQTRPLRLLPGPAARRQAAAILRPPRHRPRPDRGELRRRLRPDRPGRRDPRPVLRPGPARPRPPRAGLARDRRSPDPRPGPPRPPDPARSPSSWTTPPPTSPCSPSPPTPTNARPTSARSRGSGRSLPDGSYGQRNRQAIAARETRIAARLRAVEQAYRTATEHDTAYTPPEPGRRRSAPEPAADRGDRAGVELSASPPRTVARGAVTQASEDRPRDPEPDLEAEP